jgi:hypothetical protein
MILAIRASDFWLMKSYFPPSSIRCRLILFARPIHLRLTSDAEGVVTALVACWLFECGIAERA